MAKNTTLRTLKFGNVIDDQNTYELAAFLQNNSTLQRLDLGLVSYCR